MTRKITLTGGFLALALHLFAQPNAAVLDYIAAYKQLAVDEMLRTGVPAAITLAQGIHESEAGKSDLAGRSNNHFGIKCKNGWNGDRVYHNDDEENECFRSYPSAEASYRDHSDFLRNNPRYQFLFQLDPEDYSSWANGLKKAGYATNDQYAPLLVKLIETYQLQQYTLLALGKAPSGKELLTWNGNGNNPVVRSAGNSLSGGPNEELTSDEPPAIDYPSGVFKINDTRVIFAPAGSSLLAIADQYELKLEHLMDFNDLQLSDVLPRGQLLYLQRKRKRGNAPYHIVQRGETLYAIAQAEGVRLESLQRYNALEAGAEPDLGEKIYLQDNAPVAPRTRDSRLSDGDTEAVAKEVKPSLSSSRFVHKVQRRETLYSISRKYGTSVDQLMKWNALDEVAIQEGQELIIYNQKP